MPKRESESPDINWDSEEAAESSDDSAEFSGGGSSRKQDDNARPGFHLQAARRIEEAREKRALRKAIEDFNDYDV
jgi:hypothetical protein